MPRMSDMDWKPPYDIDPLVRMLTAETIDDDVASYVSLLDREAPEHEIHQFLCDHSYFLWDDTQPSRILATLLQGKTRYGV